MNQLGLFGFESRVWSVTDLNRYVRQALEGDYRLQDLWIAGEVSNVSRPASGHLYFTLKDSQASVRCVMWRPEVARLVFQPQEGQALEVHGHVSVYEAGGQYQLYADALRLAGEGDLFRQFLRLKAKLEAEGLFDEERKRPLPPFPKRIGIVTSPSAAALRDVLNVLRRRFPLAEVVLSPTPVQGAEAIPGIVSALEAFRHVGPPDVILLVRGGGSAEDLAAFNDEAVARAIAASRVPVVTGVGHETDFTIADFVADRRAPTPSAAAEIVTPDRGELALDVAALRRGLADYMIQRLQILRGDLDDLQHRLGLASPRGALANARQRLDDLLQRAEVVIHHKLELHRAGLVGMLHTLAAVGPASVLTRGYAIVKRLADDHVVRSVQEVVAGTDLIVRVADGTFGASVSASPEPGEGSSP
jgi:exodeoxyribonuclease VII large subunit